ncbi:MAG: MipA/OmpV family protein [Alphaproteobacteria bacterium]|nr:MipA/OmpV family protein [Alphaproteobacteria bacterium]
MIQGARILVSAFILTLPSAVLAQEARKPTLTVSAGIGAKPEYEGADTYEPLPLLEFDHENRFIEVRSRGLGIEADFAPALTFQAGPLARYRGGRDDDVDNSAVAALSEVGESIELGAYIGGGAPLQRLGINDPGIVAGRLSFAHDVNEGHDGFLVEGSLSFIRPVTDDLKAIVSLSTSYASGRYMDAFFDVSAADSVASGLAPFSANAGFKDVGITGVIRYAFTDNWSAAFIGNYTRLVGDAADSSIVKQAGSPNQFFSGISINYKAF